ncbi:MAG: thioester reductase, partial [Cyanobacteria bacterium RYN_339]|nr:thioester reductase [Cyanobacteria bacterium RYN_339]
ATVVIAPDEARTPAALKAWLAGVDHAFVPTALLDAMLAEPWPHPPALVLTGGDRLTRRPPPGLRLVNHYGPTEASVVATAGEVPSQGPGAPTIGRPIAGAIARVLDPLGGLVPVGLPGELCVGGPGLARGYWRDPELTAAKFFTAEDGSPLYRTGDRARWRADGELEFLGRLDDQLQIRGVRVEPAEVAAALAEHPAVREAYVAGIAGPDGVTELVGYLAGPVDEREAVRAFARTRLPAAFVPTAWVWLPQLPMTPHGKLDRVALPAPERTTTRWEPPQGELETAIAALWAEALGVERVGRHDDFFALGGHSLLAMRLVDTMRTRLGLEPGLRALFLHPTPAGLATQLAPAAAAPVLLRGDLAAPFPLTEVQEAYWVGRQTAGVSAHAYVEFEPLNLDLAKLQAALDALVRRHPQLRAVISADGRQQVLPDVPAFPVDVHDLRSFAPAVQAERLESLRAELAHAVRPADRWPLFGVTVALLDDHRTRLHLGFDALIADAASLGILARELGALLLGEALPPAPALTFQDYVLTARAVASGPAGDRARAYWLDRLEALPPAPALPEGDATPGPARFERHAGGLPLAAWERLRATAREAGVAPAAVLLTAFSLVLARFSRSPRFTLNLTRFDRRRWHPDVDGVVGDFTALSLLEVDLPAGSFLQAARALQDRLWQDLDHPDAGGVWTLRELARRRGATPMPVVFTGVLDQDVAAALPAALGKPGFGASQTPQVDLDHQAMLSDGALAHHWDVRVGAYPPGLATAMFAAYEGVLARLAVEPWTAWPEVLPDATLAAIAAYNQVPDPPPADTLWAAFARQAAATPAAPAVLAGDVSLTYAELDQQARIVANHLMDAGIQRGDRVAIAMDKGWEPVAAALGVLAAGAAYVPIDPETPPTRRHQLVEATGARVVLVQPGGPTDWHHRVVTREDAEARPVPGPGELAYIIFTSGSTGTPKGVAVTHAAAMTTVAEVNRRWGVGAADRVLALSALGFDLSVYDLFGPLAAGGTVVMPPPRSQRDPDAWLAAIDRHRVTLWNSVPALMALLLARLDGAPGPVTLRLALLSGDWVPADLPDRLRLACPAVEVVALGGATEAAIWSICQPCPPGAGWAAVPYGRPLAGQAFHVLDDGLRPRPPGVPGELYIGGASLAVGYWGDAERTAERFVTALDGTRLYRTGDWGRWIPGDDGALVIEFLGREDQQVKILGQRIELGEIEATLARCPGLDGAAVAAVGPTRGDKHLVGYLTPAGADSEAAAAFLRERLPAGMVPRAWHVLDALPLTANGKVDRAALARLAPVQVAAAPATALEARLATLFAEVLERPDLDPTADLLALGVNSIDLVRLANRLESELGHRPDLADMFALRTLRDLAAYYQDHGQAPKAAVLVDPAQREAFKQAQRTRRLPAGPRQPLAGTSKPSRRESARAFTPGPVPAEAVGRLMAAL